MGNFCDGIEWKGFNAIAVAAVALDAADAAVTFAVTVAIAIMINHHMIHVCKDKGELSDNEGLHGHVLWLLVLSLLLLLLLLLL